MFLALICRTGAFIHALLSRAYLSVSEAFYAQQHYAIARILCYRPSVCPSDGGIIEKRLK